MLIYIKGHSVVNPLMEIVHAMTGEKARVTGNLGDADVISIYEANKITTIIIKDSVKYTRTMERVILRGRDEAKSVIDSVKICYYILACEVYNKQLPWGCMTGIRPAKTAAKYMDNIKQFEKDYFVSEEKASLAVKVAKHQQKVSEKINTEDIGIYIGIPFCPTRCLYCSFVSLPMDKQIKFVEPYVENLCREIEYTGKILKECGIKTGTIYIGGGTPTSINEEQLDMVLDAVNQNLKAGSDIEFTVEAGRADTITKGKLEAMQKNGVTRISINPQTMNDNILQNIGRKHTAQEFINAYKLARKLGFDNINTDIIAGLPGEDYENFMSSLNRLLELNPESVTVHTMCVKRAAALKFCIENANTFSPTKMVSSANLLLESTGYIPYYMYRQKDTLDNLENTGYSKKSYECIYNIFMMEDMGSVIGIGAGSVSKIIDPATNRIDRIFNLKDAYEYVKSFDEIINRKNKLKEMFFKD